LAFTLSCSGGDDNDGGGSSSPSGGWGKSSSSRQSGSSSDYCNEELPPVAYPYCNDEEGVEIGGQIWSKCNLNVVPSTGKSFCYCNKPENCEKYGRLYNWATAMALPDSCNFDLCPSLISSPHQGLCPAGWHIPSDDEWGRVLDYVENEHIDSLGPVSINGRGAVGVYFKATSGWNIGEKNDNGTDVYGFSALPGGSGYYSDYYGVGFYDAGQIGQWWSSTDYIHFNGSSRVKTADNWSLGTNNYFFDNLITSFSNNVYLYSVRCVRDTAKPEPPPKPTNPVVSSCDISDYKTVTIGDQVWMAENLNCNIAGSKCAYSNVPDAENALTDYNTSACEKYGRLYNWTTAMALSTTCVDESCSKWINTPHQGICPSGWHIPTVDELDKLLHFVDNTDISRSPYQSETAGKLLKSTSGWDSYDGKSGNGTDKFGFSVLPNGSGYECCFEGIGQIGSFWATNEGTQYTSSREYNAHGLFLRYKSAYAGSGEISKEAFRAVRCLKD